MLDLLLNIESSELCVFYLNNDIYKFLDGDMVSRGKYTAMFFSISVKNNQWGRGGGAGLQTIKQFILRTTEV